MPFSIPISNDALVELDETAQLTLSNPINATTGPPATLTILDDDPPTVAFTASTFTVNENQAAAGVNVSLNAASGRPVTVNFATGNGTATAGSDYTAASGILTFAAGETNKTILVSITNDTLDELTETIFVTLTSPANASLGTPAVATLNILDDDPPTVGFSSGTYSVSENAGSVAITVQMSKPYGQAVFVDYATGMARPSRVAITRRLAAHGGLCPPAR